MFEKVFLYIVENIYTVMFYSVIVTYIFSFISSFYIKRVFNHYNKMKFAGFSDGYSVAVDMLRKNNIRNVKVYYTSKGDFSDHYSPKDKKIVLSSPVSHGNTILSMAVAAHESGHALQDARKNLLFLIRRLVVPIVNLGTIIATPLFIFSTITKNGLYFRASILFLFGSLLFSIITFPVEVDASRKAYKFLVREGYIFTRKDKRRVKRVLRAAAFTYFVAIIRAFSNSVIILSRIWMPF